MIREIINPAKAFLLMRLLEEYSNMNVDRTGKVDYEELYVEMETLIHDWQRIKTIETLDEFCDDYSLNDGDSAVLKGLSTVDLIKKFKKTRTED